MLFIKKMLYNSVDGFTLLGFPFVCRCSVPPPSLLRLLLSSPSFPLLLLGRLLNIDGRKDLSSHSRRMIQIPSIEGGSANWRPQSSKDLGLKALYSCPRTLTLSLVASKFQGRFEKNMSHLKTMSHFDGIPSSPGKFKADKPSLYFHRLRLQSSLLSRVALWSLLFFTLIVFICLLSPPSSGSSYSQPRRDLLSGAASWGGREWERLLRKSATPRSPSGRTVLVTGAAGFVGFHVSRALRLRGDGVVGLDNFNDYYDPGLKRARQNLLSRSGVLVVEGDINDPALLEKLFDVVPFTHVMHLAAQAGVRYAMENPSSYIHSNIVGFVNLLEVCKSANPQPAIIWASSSSVYGLNSKVPFSEKDRTDRPASLYAATKKAGEEIAHTYNHIYGLSITGLRFFTVYGPWGRPDMAYFFFTKNILKGKQITIYEGPDHSSVARDFTYIDDIVKGCLGALDTAKKSTGSAGKKTGTAQFRLFNLGNTSPVPVTELVRILEKLLKVKAKKKVLPLPRNGDVKFTHANISLAHSELGYKPKTDLETGLKKFVKWYSSYYNGSKNAFRWSILVQSGPWSRCSSLFYGWFFFFLASYLEMPRCNLLPLFCASVSWHLLELKWGGVVDDSVDRKRF